MQPLHKAQLSILEQLRHAPQARFSDVMRPTGLTSDAFKFHIKKLVSLGYVQKTLAGEYSLTSSGKEFANNLDRSKRVVQKQPKLSVMIVASKQNDLGQTTYLVQHRKRSPFYGYWCFVSGPVQWGEEFEQTASRELLKQTGLQATFRVRAFYRQKDYQEDASALLEDKLFVIVEATNSTGELHDEWEGGTHAWMTLDDIKQQPKYFEAMPKVIDLLTQEETYTSQQTMYEAGEY